MNHKYLIYFLFFFIFISLVNFVNASIQLNLSTGGIDTWVEPPDWGFPSSTVFDVGCYAHCDGSDGGGTGAMRYYINVSLSDIHGNVTSAKYFLYISDTYYNPGWNYTAANVSAYRVTSSWGTGNAWNNQPSFSSTSSASIVIPNGNTGGLGYPSHWVNWTLNASEINAMATGALPNYGFVFKTEETVDSNAKVGYTYDASSNKPYLQILYDPETIPPYFTTIPANTTITYLQGFAVTFAGADITSPPVTFSLGNWSNLFTINSTGYLQNITGNIGAGAYIINITINDTSGNTNFTWYNVTINKATSQTNLTFDKPTPQTYGTAITPYCALFTGVGSVSLTNGTSGVAETLGAGTWGINCSYAGNTNYTQSSNFTNYVINQAGGNINLLLNGTASNINFVSGGWINASASTTTGQTIQLLRNGIVITNENNIYNKTLGVGYYNYTANALSNTNYTFATITRFLNITPAIPPTISTIVIYPNPLYDYNNASCNVTSSAVSGYLTTADIEWYYSNGTFISGFSIPNGNYGVSYTFTHLLSNTNYTRNDQIYCRARVYNNGGGISTWSSASTLQVQHTFNPAIISIKYPLNITYNIDISSLNYTATNLPQSCWYSTNGGTTNITTNCNLNITGLTSIQGSNTWKVYSNNSFNDINFTAITFFKDTIFPQIDWGTGTLPDYSNFSQSNIYMNTTWTELNIKNIIFGYWDINNNTNWNTFTYTNDPTIFRVNFTGLTSGIYKYNVSICDTSNNCNQTSTRKITLDTKNPNITLSSPANNTITNVVSQNLTANISDLNIKNYSLFIYNSTNALINQTTGNIPSSPSVIAIVYKFLYDDIFTWLYKAWDFAGNVFTSNRNTITIETTNPLINIVSPVNTTYSTTSLSLNVNSPTAIKFWYSFNKGKTNTTFTSPTTISAVAGNNNLRVYGNDTIGNANYTEVNFYVSYTSQLDVILRIDKYAEFGANITLQALTTSNNTNVTSCNFTLQSPTKNIFNNSLGIKNGNTWNSTSYTISETGTFNYNVTCTNEFGINTSVSDLFDISYNMIYTPNNYSFASRVSPTERNNITVYMYDDSNSNVNYSIKVYIQNSSNFTLTYPSSLTLNESDSVTSKYSFIVGVQALAGTLNGTYAGNITLNNTLNNNISYIYFNYGIKPPSGIPQLTTTGDTICVSDFNSICSNPTLTLLTGQSLSISYKVKNIGQYLLTGCSIKYTGDLNNQSWISDSLSLFNLDILSAQTFSITFAPTSQTGVYIGNVYVSCASGDSLGSPIDSSPDNRPVEKITINPATITPGNPGGGTQNPSEINRTEILEGICGNLKCESNYNETYLSCPQDCQGTLTPLTNCFSLNSTTRSNCFLLSAGLGGSFILIFIVLVILILTFIKFRSNKKSSGHSILTIPQPKRRKR